MTIRLTSLQKITELKSKITLQANWQYADSLRELETEQDKLQEMEHENRLAALELHQRTTHAVSAQEVQAWTLYMIAKRRQIETQHRVIADKREVCTEKHGELTACFLDEKVWTKLQERRQDEHRAHLNKVAQEMLDELAVTGYRRIGG